MTDWVAWPIFIFQALTIVLLLFSREKKLFGIRLKIFAILFLLLVCIAIVVSLYHDSTEILNIYL